MYHDTDTWYMNKIIVSWYWYIFHIIDTWYYVDTFCGRVTENTEYYQKAHHVHSHTVHSAAKTHIS